MRVAVAEGAVTLRGAVPRAAHRRAARACARGVPGVLGVRDETVADEDLVVGVAQALLADPDTRAAHLLVACRRGAGLAGRAAAVGRGPDHRRARWPPRCPGSPRCTTAPPCAAAAGAELRPGHGHASPLEGRQKRGAEMRGMLTGG